MTPRLRLVLAGGCVALLSGCALFDPYQRAHTWHPTGDDTANAAAMAVNPADLVHGRGTAASDGTLAAAAVDRLRHDRAKSLSGGSTTSGSTPSAAAGQSGS